MVGVLVEWWGAVGVETQGGFEGGGEVGQPPRAHVSSMAGVRIGVLRAVMPFVLAWMTAVVQLGVKREGLLLVVVVCVTGCTVSQAGGGAFRAGRTRAGRGWPRQVNWTAEWDVRWRRTAVLGVWVSLWAGVGGCVPSIGIVHARAGHAYWVRGLPVVAIVRIKALSRRVIVVALSAVVGLLLKRGRCWGVAAGDGRRGMLGRESRRDARRYDF